LKPAIVFSHANGFPAGTYRILFDHLRAAGWRVLALPKFGHDARFPVTSNWPHLRDQLIQFIEARRAAPAYLVGHSLGGYLSLLAAARRPELALGVVLLDSPLLPAWMGRVVQFGKAFGVGERFSPAAASRRRRQQWPSADAAFAHFAAKPVFARWADGVLADYLACGLETGAEGVHLSFQRDIETRIYNTLPHHLPRLLRTHPPRCPVAFVGARASEELRRVGLRETRRLVHQRLTMLEGTHLFPMEAPQATAAAVAHWLASFEKLRAAPGAQPGALATPRL
jgi:pimeloyl-ACP methyl ester carboxylesterase